MNLEFKLKSMPLIIIHFEPKHGSLTVLLNTNCLLNTLVLVLIIKFLQNGRFKPSSIGAEQISFTLFFIGLKLQRTEMISGHLPLTMESICIIIFQLEILVSLQLSCSQILSFQIIITLSILTSLAVLSTYSILDCKIQRRFQSGPCGVAVASILVLAKSTRQQYISFSTQKQVSSALNIISSSMTLLAQYGLTATSIRFSGTI
jgi:hypothetical protein